MTVKLLTEQHMEFLSLQGGCTCSCESILVKMPHCWKSRVAAQMYFITLCIWGNNGFDKTIWMHMLVSAFAGRLRDKN